MKKTVALVLGSGAARGNTHIGVIKAIEERGYDIISIAGCSMGAIVGGVYAAGKLTEYHAWVESLTRVDVIRLLDMSILNGGYVKGDRFFQAIEEMIGTPSIESLSVPFTSVAVDLLNQTEFWFQRGDLLCSMRASSAIPSVIAPVKFNGRTYVDGGILNPLPIIPCVSAGADYIIAVDLNGPAEEPIEEMLTKSSAEPDWWSSIKETLGKVKGSSSDEFEYSVEKWGRVETVNMMFETMQESLTRYKLAGYPPDLLISMPKDIANFYEFWRAEELIEFGYNAAINALKELESPASGYHSFPKGR